MYARFNYGYHKRYFINITGRRDGSSRFGSDRRYANFGAVGAAWLFSEENKVKDLSWLSFGKVRASYGVAGNVYPVEINVHDNDGQLGLYVPYSPEQNAVNDIVANMSQTSGTNIMMTQSAGQQVAADLSRGVVQGLSGYFQKRVRQPKVIVKAGHRVLLVPKNNESKN